jgi:general secretion pathway protein A
VYTTHFGLAMRPFALTPDPSFLYHSRNHQLALDMLAYGIDSQAPLLLLTGEIGSGKTTLLRQLMNDLDDRITVGLVSNPTRKLQSLIGHVASSLDVTPADGTELAAYEAITKAALAEYAAGRRTLVVIDEAQNLSDDLLEEVRLLTNLNSDRDVMVQVLLVGQPELRHTLSKPGMRQIAQRVSADHHLRPLNARETGAYIAARIRIAGGRPGLFSIGAMAVVYVSSGGVPRLINQLCDYALVFAYADGKTVIDRDTVEEVLRARVAAGALPVFADSVPDDQSRAQVELEPRR